MTRKFEVRQINSLLPMLSNPTPTKSLLIIDAIGVFADENTSKAVVIFMSDLAENSLPFNTLLSFIFGKKGKDNTTLFISPRHLSFYLDDDEDNPGKYILKSFTVND